jgi:hypothetical protein
VAFPPIKLKKRSSRKKSLSGSNHVAPTDIVTNTLEKTVGTISEIKNILNMSQVKKLFRVGTDVFSACQPFIEKPSWWNVGRACVGIGKVLVDDVEMWPDAFFDGDEWTEPYSRDFTMTIMQVLSKFSFTTLKTADQNNFIRLIDFNGVKVGWAYHSKLNIVNQIFVETDKLQQARDNIKRLLWEQFKDKPLVMRYNKRMIINNDEPKVVFEIDDAFHPLPSQKATEYSSYLKRCLDANVPRSVMLYGPPGTGKSTMARTLVETLNLRSFRIRIEDVSALENSTLFEAISVFEPDAVILDDFDRAHAQSSLLETLEFFQRHVKLVVATVNDKSSLDEALLRPGRFDELVLVDKMDENVIRHMLGEFVDGYDDVKDWPIAFIQEYVKRRRFMDQKEATESTAELARRVRRLARYRFEDDNETMCDAIEKSNQSDDHNDPVSSGQLVTTNVLQELASTDNPSLPDMLKLMSRDGSRFKIKVNTMNQKRFSRMLAKVHRLTRKL